MRHRLVLAAAIFMMLTNSCQNKAQDYPVPVSEANEPMMTGAFEPTWESLQEYETPQWFADAKFGIWAHWGPQCVEGTGDWMARNLYYEGTDAYNYHAEHYGHPSESGFKDILPLFKAERWNPDSLIAFYKKIGAQYFVALANHHDNFDLWDSKYQPWNSMNMGPHRDILGEWAQAARRNGLPFGISIHADHAWIWYEPSQLSDKQGSRAGVPYDGSLTKADGKGKWWEGYDPQDLYAQNHPLSEGSERSDAIFNQWEWGNGACLPSAEFCTNFYNRTIDAINRYNPDLVYFDATVLPFWPVSDAGLKIAAHYYNHNMAAHNGRLEGVLFGKMLSEEQRKALVWDVERGAPDEILPQPWQSCSCIGGWHYNTGIYQSNGYKTAATVVKLLADIVSKNGNLLLSVPLRADGTFDEKEKAVLTEFGGWMDVNKEAIVGTRPWKVFGEGPIASSTVEMKAQGFNEEAFGKADAREIRFTQNDSALYVIALAWPENGEIAVEALKDSSALFPEPIAKVELLGFGNVPFVRDGQALRASLPKEAERGIAPALRIRKEPLF